ncbi:hypothetical protein ACFX1R_000609 [Malus domestica]
MIFLAISSIFSVKEEGRSTEGLDRSSLHWVRESPVLVDREKISKGIVISTLLICFAVRAKWSRVYDFGGRKDLVKFVKTVAEAGLGFPLWLHFIPGIQLRTDNEPFKAEMQRFTAKIVDMMKEKLYASQGGPIILSQIENEYGNIDDQKCGTKCKHHYEDGYENAYFSHQDLLTE